MCTIIVALGVWTDQALVVAANRDERLSRPASEPRVWPAGALADRRVLAPRDLLAGGTWLGINDAGVFVAITNRRGRLDPNRRSRGELVSRGLGASSVERALDSIRQISALDYNRFHLVIASWDQGAVIWSDGEALHHHPLAPGVSSVTERSFGAGPSMRHATLDAWATQLAAGDPPTDEGWRAILADHRPHHEDPDLPPARDAIGFDAMCVHAEALDYGTRSSTLLRVGPGGGELQFLHATGKPCQTPFTDGVALVRDLLR